MDGDVCNMLADGLNLPQGTVLHIDKPAKVIESFCVVKHNLRGVVFLNLNLFSMFSLNEHGEYQHIN